MRYGPPVRFARRPDGRHLAYQVAGDGELDLVFLFGWPTHLGLMWENPAFAGFLRRLGSFSRLILVDRLARRPRRPIPRCSSGGGCSISRGPAAGRRTTRWCRWARWTSAG